MKTDGTVDDNILHTIKVHGCKHTNICRLLGYSGDAMHFTWKHLQCTRGCITVLEGFGLCPMSRVDIGEQNTPGVS